MNPRILIVDDEPENLRALERTLKAKFDVVSVASPKEALVKFAAENFEAVVSDQKMPEMAGTAFLQEAAKIRPWVSRMILTGFTETKDFLEAINRAEIYRFITKPWDNAELVATVQQAVESTRLRKQNQDLMAELKSLNESLEKQVQERTSDLLKANEKLSELAMIDPLTKAWNRRAFSQRVVEEIQRSDRYNHEVCFAMVDVDHFKQFNDMEGHLFGDEALRKVAQILQSNLRRTDYLARWGGEEFIIMMPETKLVNAAEVCERLRAAVEGASFQGREKPAYLTISIGVSHFPRDGKSKDLLVQRADQSLYQAKQSGRNRVVLQVKEPKNESFFVR